MADTVWPWILGGLFLTGFSVLCYLFGLLSDKQYYMLRVEAAEAEKRLALHLRKRAVERADKLERRLAKAERELEKAWRRSMKKRWEHLACRYADDKRTLRMAQLCVRNIVDRERHPLTSPEARRHRLVFGAHAIRTAREYGPLPLP